MNVCSILLRLAILILAIVPTAAVMAQTPAPSGTLSVIVGNPAAPIAGDQAVINKLVSLGHVVVVHDDDGITIGATAGSDAILISTSVNSNRVGAMFRHELRPVLLWQPDLFALMGMTGVQANVDFGAESGQTQLNLVSNSTAIGSGLPLGPTLVTSGARTYSWGVPALSAQVIATLLNNAGRAALFVYEQGDVLADNNVAVGKRAGIYLASHTAIEWAPAGELLFEQTIEWMLTAIPKPPTILVQPLGQNVAAGAAATFSVTAGGYPAPTYQWRKNGVDLPGETGSTLTFTATAADVGEYTARISNSEGAVTSAPAALTIIEARTFSLVVGDSANVIAGDQAVINKLESLGHAVVVHDDDGITVGATAGSDALLLSASVNPNRVGAVFRNELRPVLLWQTGLFAPMGMTGIQENADFGVESGQTQLNLVGNGTTIGGGLPTGPTLVTTGTRSYSWGLPGGSAQVIATLLNNGRAALFVYDQGDVLADNSAAVGKRAGVYLASHTALDWAPPGELLFEQTVLWLFGDGVPRPVAPTIVTQPMSHTVVEGSAAAFTVVADGNPSPTYRWQYAGIDLPGETGSTLSFTASLADAGDYRVVVANSQGSVTSAVATLTVVNANDPPRFTSAPVTGATQGAAYTYDVSATDPELILGDRLSFSGASLPAWLTLLDNGDGTAVLTGTPGSQHVGPNNVTLVVRDLGGLTATQAFTIFVGNTNDAPSFTSTPMTNVDEGDLYRYTVIANDPDAGDTLTISATTLPGWLTLADNGNGTASLRGTPRQADLGDHSVALRVTDAAGTADSQSFTVTVANVEFSPIFTSRPVTAATEGQPYRYGIIAGDADGDPVNLRAGTLPGWITFTNDGDGTGELLGFPAGVHIGFHAVELFAEDATGTTVASQTFTIVVNAAADAPVITLKGNPQMVIRQGESFRDPGATAMDPQDGDLTSLILVDNPVDARVLGSYAVRYSVKDTAGNEAQAQRTVIVQRQVDGGGGSIGLAELLALLLLVGAASLPRSSRREAGPA